MVRPIACGGRLHARGRRCQVACTVGSRDDQQVLQAVDKGLRDDCGDENRTKALRQDL